MDLLAVVLITLRTFSAITLVKIVALNRSALTPVVLQKTQTNVNVERERANLCVMMVNIVKSLVTLQPVIMCPDVYPLMVRLSQLSAHASVGKRHVQQAIDAILPPEMVVSVFVRS